MTIQGGTEALSVGRPGGRAARLRDALVTGGGIAWRLAGWIVAASFIITVLTTAVQLYFLYENDLRSINERFEEIRSSQLPVLTNSVWILDGALIQTQLDGLSRLPDIETLKVVVNGKEQWSVGNAHSRDVLTENFPLVQHNREKDLEIGHLVITASLDNVYNRLYARVLSETLSNLVRTALIAAFALIMFQLTVTRHLSRLAQYAQSIDVTKRDLPDIELDRPRRRSMDMLDQLAGAVNGMRGNLTAAFVAARGNEERIGRENQTLSELLRIRSGETENLAAFFSMVCERVCHGLDVGSTGVWRFDPTAETFETLGGYIDESKRRQMPGSIPSGKLPHLLAVLRRERVFAFADSENDDRLASVRANFRGEIMPVRSGIVAATQRDGQIGLVLVVGELDRTREWQGDEINFVSAVATLLAAAMEADEKQQAQRELSSYKDQLEQIVAMRTAELTQANMELSRTLEVLRSAQAELVEREKLASLGSVVAGVAHEANTPIGVGVTAASALKDATERLAEKFQANAMKKSDLDGFIDTALRSTEILGTNLKRAAELMRSFKQIAVDQSSESVRVIELGTYVNDVITSLRPELRKRHHTVEVTVEESISIETTPSAIWQIMSNLVMNSMVHGYEPDQRGKFEITVARSGDTAVITYRDDGKGMPAEVRRRVFEPFFTTRRGQGGSGLGLTIAYNLATKTLGGTIACKSAPDAGTEFTITIPIREQQRGAA